MATVLEARPGYDEDFYLWGLDQAERLRGMAQLRINQAIDWELVAEEIEDLAKNERHACEAYVEQIIAHLLKLEHSDLSEPLAHWSGEVATFRANLARKMTGSIKRHLEDTLIERWRTGRKIAIARMRVDHRDINAKVPDELPYSFDQLVDDWLPELPTDTD